MKRFHLIIFIALLSIVSTTAKTRKQLVVLHTNDTHSTIMPLNENLDNKDLAGRGGCLRRINMIKEERKQNPDLLFFDSGDFSQGSGYYTLFKGEVEVGLMNQMGYDAATIGNHEFDFGLNNLAKLIRMANFPIVCSNYDFTGTPCEGLVKDYITLHRNGLKIGVFALGAPMKGLVSNKNCEGVIPKTGSCRSKPRKRMPAVRTMFRRGARRKRLKILRKPISKKSRRTPTA